MATNNASARYRATQRATRAATTAKVQAMLAQTAERVRQRQQALEQEQRAAHLAFAETLIGLEAAAPLKPAPPMPLFSRLLSLERQMKLLLRTYLQLKAEYEQATATA